MDKEQELKLAKKAIRGNPDTYGELITCYQEYLYKMAFLYLKKRTGFSGSCGHRDSERLSEQPHSQKPGMVQDMAYQNSDQRGKRYTKKVHLL